MKKTYEFINNINEITTCDIYFPKSISPQEKTPLVLLVHGFRAFKDWGFFPYFAESLVANNFLAATIDFSLNTLLDKDKSIFDMSRFARNTISQQISEINLFINQLENNQIGEEKLVAWNREIYLVGHSLGGALAIVAAENSPKTIKKLVTVNSIFDFDIYTDKQKEKWFDLGIKEFFDSATNQKFVLNLEFLTDRLTYNNNKSLTATVSRLEIPYLIIHSDADATVSPKAANILYSSVKNKKLAELRNIRAANHTLGITHPFKKSSLALEEVINLTINFLNARNTNLI